MNTINLIGNIATELDMRYTPQGDAVVTFNLAVKRPFSKDKTDFIPVEAWKRQAENTVKYCAKGSKIAVSEGTLVIDQWEKDGQKRSKAKVNAGQIIFLDSKKSNENKTESVPESEGQPIDVSDDSLPF